MTVELKAKQAVKKITDSLIFEINYEEDNYDAGYSASLHNHGEALYMTGFSEGQSNPKIKPLNWEFHGIYYSAQTAFGAYILEENEENENMCDLYFGNLLLCNNIPLFISCWQIFVYNIGSFNA